MKPHILLARFALPLSLLTTAARAELSAAFEGGGAKDTRVDRLPALLVNAGESATPFLPAGEFTATWTGKLILPDRLRLEFSFEGEGKATLKVGDKELLAEEGQLGTKVSEVTRLKGEHDITITYKSKADGTGRFRLFWKEASFPRQSVPPTAFAAVAPATDLARQGRLLFTENHCAKCHTPDVLALGGNPMAEFGELAPLLMATGDRLNEEWVARWIADPSALRHDTRMPTLVDASTPEGKQQAADLAAWLMSMKLGAPAAPAPDKALAEKGGAHFHRLGCAACHTGPQAVPAADIAKGRVPLHNVAAKFQPGALSGFLKKPEQWYSHIGMPNFNLSDEEANSIAAYLLDASGKVEQKKESFPKGDATKGAALAQTLNCGGCHAGTGIPNYASPVASIFTKDWAATGCVSGKHGGKVPKLALTEDDRKALVAFVKKEKASESLARHVPAEYASAKLQTLRCASCHGMDGKASLLDTVHLETKDLVAHVAGEHEKVDQSRPQLTYIGEMLHSAYLESMIGGKLPSKPRPWLDMRMPGFSNYATGLANGLAAIHGVVPGKAEPANPDAAKAEVGKMLVGSKGFDCTTCHAVGSKKATAAFEVEGLNFALSHERLRHEWYVRWIDNPLSVTPSTKMPRYGDKEGKTPRPEFNQDAAQQFDAIWQYLQKPE